MVGKFEFEFLEFTIIYFYLTYLSSIVGIKWFSTYFLYCNIYFIQELADTLTLIPKHKHKDNNSHELHSSST